MRTLKLALAAVAALAVNANAQVTGMGSPPDGNYQNLTGLTAIPPMNPAFHAGGVASCDGCHVMHNASDGVAKSTTGLGASVAPWTNVTNMYLLQGSDQSSTCLICHSGAQAASREFTIADLTSTTNPTNFTPGGDFGWVRSTFNFTNSPSDRHGHNVAAADYGLTNETAGLTVAPGGTYTPGTGRRAFGCINCHDPHGRYRMQQDASQPYEVAFAGPFPGSPATLPIASSGSYGEAPTAAYAVGAYRLLGGQYYAPASNPSYPFPNNPPIAVAPANYNETEAINEVRVAYGTGMSEWCQNCHTNIHLDGYTTGVAGLRHPAGSDALLHAGQIAVYNTYISSGVMNPALTDNYTSLVPFEVGKNGTFAGLLANTDPAAAIPATTSSNVMCLSCHRAHATAFDSMIRWDQNATFLTDGGDFTPGLTNRTQPQTQAGYYGRSASQIGLYQRSLCNKCHGKD